eukprot:gb/GECH01004602.1/.p1 GENE.gb/GECH01004602.1/~~gb/GECH01004602.1/.p1  ORF type:complete len:404 (+),score=107.90 gb/GECH01004602.1/:1-1212(+)
MTKMRARSKLTFSKNSNERMRISEPVLRHTTSLHPLQSGSNTSNNGSNDASTTAASAAQTGEDPVHVFLKGEKFPQKKPRVIPNEVNENSIKTLSESELWKEVFKLCEKSRHSGFTPTELNQYRLAQITSLFQLKTYDFATKDLQHIPKDGPFTLSRFKAELPHFQEEQNTSLALDRLYTLLDRVRTVMQYLENNNPVPESLQYDGEKDISVWQSREKVIILTIVNVHLDESKYDLALQWMERLSDQFPSDAQLFSLKGCMYLRIGMVKPAEESFQVVESLLSSDAVTSIINRGYVAFANGKFSTAYEYFAKALETKPLNVTAANNCAICLLYTENLTKAIESLEDFIRQDPNETLDEVVVFNLCTLYELEGDSNQEKKHVINALVRRFKGDNFPSSALKLSS